MKYKVGDVLQTRVGNFFIIKKVKQKARYSASLGNEYVGTYELQNHPHEELPIEYVDNARHIFLATPAGKVLFGTATSEN